MALSKVRFDVCSALSPRGELIGPGHLSDVVQSFK